MHINFLFPVIVPTTNADIHWCLFYTKCCLYLNQFKYISPQNEIISYIHLNEVLRPHSVSACFGGKVSWYIILTDCSILSKYGKLFSLKTQFQKFSETLISRDRFLGPSLTYLKETKFCQNLTKTKIFKVGYRDRLRLLRLRLLRLLLRGC